MAAIYVPCDRLNKIEESVDQSPPQTWPICEELDCFIDNPQENWTPDKYKMAKDFAHKWCILVLHL